MSFRSRCQERGRRSRAGLMRRKREKDQSGSLCFDLLEDIERADKILSWLSLSEWHCHWAKKSTTMSRHILKVALTLISIVGAARAGGHWSYKFGNGKALFQPLRWLDLSLRGMSVLWNNGTTYCFNLALVESFTLQLSEVCSLKK